eukprot:3178848-Prorocentrum_lima.AAC.1
MARRLQQLDHCFAVLRHISKESCANMMQELYGLKQVESSSVASTRCGTSSPPLSPLCPATHFLQHDYPCGAKRQFDVLGNERVEAEDPFVGEAEDALKAPVGARSEAT